MAGSVWDLRQACATDQATEGAQSGRLLYGSPVPPVIIRLVDTDLSQEWRPGSAIQMDTKQHGHGQLARGTR